uniref:Uncharacterized protein n=1 Tax=Ditylenchus dipsaci TaxID=166011 RepID=A0A915E7V2_9BILA
MENIMQVPIPMVTCTNPAPDQVLANPAGKQSGLSYPPPTSNGCCHLWSTDWPATNPAQIFNALLPPSQSIQAKLTKSASRNPVQRHRIREAGGLVAPGNIDSILRC